ncbi:MAG: restriction endonuclease [Phycisphaerae bacterium]|nr:MAG: restriction endonuclease [Planctomycetota bacterium]KAB2944252.1 MAG: restriction endonuclease [Phycisphaerae bacterium]MBE7456363.1 restriction endonuclease [Planctomycetia bacterium]MCL4718481.1 restriction endonuclease [Phycisphaerae bacterium]MCQ3921121.1 restriction endonuclease [Planctomycetota bacterium]
MRNHDDGLREAVRYFWNTRHQQTTRQGQDDDRDRGGRSAVTGGKQMNGFIQFVRELLLESKVPQSSIEIGKRVELPGWFRAEKKWDLIVTHGGELLAAIEFKSQVGPSFGNNFNNRAEEALGSATDIWAAYREGAFKPSSRPYLGYLMSLEDCDKSRVPVKVVEPHFRVFSEFKKASYRERYAILVEKLLRERLYDGACLILSSPASGTSGDYLESFPELTFSKFLVPLMASVGRIPR